jgi:hypothetical protein
MKTKTLLLKWFLIISGVIQLAYWGLSHLFYPAWYLRSVGMNELAANPGETVIFLNEIGVLTIGVAVATILAAFNPIKNFAIIISLIVISLGSIATSLYGILYRNMAHGEWTTVIVLGVQLIILFFLYPWNKISLTSDRV